MESTYLLGVNTSLGRVGVGVRNVSKSGLLSNVQDLVVQSEQKHSQRSNKAAADIEMRSSSASPSLAARSTKVSRTPRRL